MNVHNLSSSMRRTTDKSGASRTYGEQYASAYGAGLGRWLEQPSAGIPHPNVEQWFILIGLLCVSFNVQNKKIWRYYSSNEYNASNIIVWVKMAKRVTLLGCKSFFHINYLWIRYSMYWRSCFLIVQWAQNKKLKALTCTCTAIFKDCSLMHQRLNSRNCEISLTLT